VREETARFGASTQPGIPAVELLTSPDDLGRLGTTGQQVEPGGPVGQIDVRLGGERPCPRRGGRDKGTDRQELRGHCDTPGLRLGVSHHDGEGHVPHRSQ